MLYDSHDLCQHILPAIRAFFTLTFQLNISTNKRPSPLKINSVIFSSESSPSCWPFPRGEHSMLFVILFNFKITWRPNATARGAITLREGNEKLTNQSTSAWPTTFRRKLPTFFRPTESFEDISHGCKSAKLRVYVTRHRLFTDLKLSVEVKIKISRFIPLPHPVR